MCQAQPPHIKNYTKHKKTDIMSVNVLVCPLNLMFRPTFIFCLHTNTGLYNPSNLMSRPT